MVTVHNNITACPLYPPKRTLSGTIGMSAKGQKRTSRRISKACAQTNEKADAPGNGVSIREPCRKSAIESELLCVSGVHDLGLRKTRVSRGAASWLKLLM